MEASAPLEAIGRYRGALLVLHGTDDRVISPDNGAAAEAAASNASETTLITIEGADHGFGFFSPDPLARGVVLKSSVDFFRSRLLAAD